MAEDLAAKMERLRRGMEERLEREEARRQEIRRAIGEHDPRLLEFLDEARDKLGAKLEYLSLPGMTVGRPSCRWEVESVRRKKA